MPNSLKPSSVLPPQAFDALFEKVFTAEAAHQRSSHPLRTDERIERLVQRYRNLWREYLTLTLMYLRQYPIQELLAAGFGISQGQLSKIVERMSQRLLTVLPTPEITAQAILTFVESLPSELLEDYGAPIIIDVTEQRIERNKDQSQQQKDYSGKKVS